MRKLATAICLLALAAIGVTQAGAHAPGSDGGGGKKSCGVLAGVSKDGPVGVGSNGVTCSVAKRVARRSVRGEKVRKWRCTGRGTRFGHCHNRHNGRRTVNWYASH